MKESLIIGIEVQYDVSVVHDAARGFECNGDSRKLCLKIGIVAGMELVSRVVAEHDHGDAGLYILQ